MATINQVMNGATAFIDSQILPHLSGAKKYGAAVYIALLELNAVKTIKDAVNAPAVKVLGIVDGEEIDTDRLHTAMVQTMHNDKLLIDIPFIGTFSFTSADVDKLFEFIGRAGK